MFATVAITVLLLGHHLLVEGKLRSLQNDTITPSSLSRPGRNLGKKTSRGKLAVQSGLQRAGCLSALVLFLHIGGKLGQVLGLATGRLLDTNLGLVVLLIPSLEGVGIHNNDGTLDESLGTDQLVVGGVVGHVQHTGFPCADLGSPRKVTGIELESAKLLVASHAPNGVDTRLTNLGHGWWPAQLELALLAELGAATSGLAAFVVSLTRNTLS